MNHADYNCDSVSAEGVVNNACEASFDSYVENDVDIAEADKWAELRRRITASLIPSGLDLCFEGQQPELESMGNDNPADCHAVSTSLSAIGDSLSTVQWPNDGHQQATSSGHGVDLKSLLHAKPKEISVFSVNLHTLRRDLGREIKVSQNRALLIGALRDHIIELKDSSRHVRVALTVTSNKLLSLNALLAAWLTDLQQALLIGGRLSRDLSNQLAVLLNESGRTIINRLADIQYAGKGASNRSAVNSRIQQLELCVATMQKTVDEVMQNTVKYKRLIERMKLTIGDLEMRYQKCQTENKMVWCGLQEIVTLFCLSLNHHSPQLHVFASDVVCHLRARAADMFEKCKELIMAKERMECEVAEREQAAEDVMRQAHQMARDAAAAEACANEKSFWTQKEALRMDNARLIEQLAAAHRRILELKHGISLTPGSGSSLHLASSLSSTDHCAHSHGQSFTVDSNNGLLDQSVPETRQHSEDDSYCQCDTQVRGCINCEKSRSSKMCTGRLVSDSQDIGACIGNVHTHRRAGCDKCRENANCFNGDSCWIQESTYRTSSCDSEHSGEVYEEEGFDCYDSCENSAHDKSYCANKCARENSLKEEGYCDDSNHFFEENNCNYNATYNSNYITESESDETCTASMHHIKCDVSTMTEDSMASSCDVICGSGEQCQQSKEIEWMRRELSEVEKMLQSVIDTSNEERDRLLLCFMHSAHCDSDTLVQLSHDDTSKSLQHEYGSMTLKHLILNTKMNTLRTQEEIIREEFQALQSLHQNFNLVNERIAKQMSDTNTNTSLMIDSQHLQADACNMAEENRRLKADSDRLQATLTAKTEKIKLYCEKCELLSKKVDLLTEEHEELLSDLAESRTDTASLQKQVRMLQFDKSTLEKEVKLLIFCRGELNREVIALQSGGSPANNQLELEDILKQCSAAGDINNSNTGVEADSIAVGLNVTVKQPVRVTVRLSRSDESVGKQVRSLDDQLANQVALKTIDSQDSLQALLALMQATGRLKNDIVPRCEARWRGKVKEYQAPSTIYCTSVTHSVAAMAVPLPHSHDLPLSPAACYISQLECTTPSTQRSPLPTCGDYDSPSLLFAGHVIASVANGVCDQATTDSTASTYQEKEWQRGRVSATDLITSSAASECASNGMRSGYLATDHTVNSTISHVDSDVKHSTHSSLARSDVNLLAQFVLNDVNATATDDTGNSPVFVRGLRMSNISVASWPRVEVVAMGCKLVVPVRVDRVSPHFLLHWHFSTEPIGVTFSVKFSNGTGPEPDVVLVASQRTLSHRHSVTGCVPLNKEGLFLLAFSNMSSFINVKVTLLLKVTSIDSD